MRGRAILYAAKSTEDKRGSIPTQHADGRAMAEREGWEIVGEYADEAASAWTGDRGPQLTAAMQHAEREAPTILVVQHSDRLARGDGRVARHLGEVYFWALKAEVEIRSVQDDSTFTNPLLTFAMGERNAEDSRRKSLAVRAGMQRRREAGKHNGGPRPYGYRHGEDGLEIAKAEAEIVRRIFARFVAGSSLTAIARELHRDEIRTIHDGLWRQSTVSGILKNPVYIGRIRHGGETYDATHEPIVDQQTWDHAESLRAAVPRRGRPPKGQHLFRGGLLRCQCGEAMVPRTNGGYEFYYCNGSAKLGKDFCTQGAIRRAVIDTAVYAYFEQVGLDVEATRLQLSDERDRNLAEIHSLRTEAEHEVQRATERLARVRRDYTDGKLDAADWTSFRDELTAELEASRAEVGRLSASETGVEQNSDLVEAETETLRRLSEIRRAVTGEVRDAEGTEAVRAAFSRLFDRFVLHPQGNPQFSRQHRDDPPPEGPSTAPLLDVDQYVIEIWVREQVLVGYDENLRPILRRTSLDQAENKERIGSPWRYMSGPE